MSLPVMSFADGDEVRRLRLRLRELIREELPADYRGAFVAGTAGQLVANEFCRRLAAEQLLTINWPTEYGGGGAGVWEQAAFREEMWAHHEPRGAQYMGLNWVGPAIMRFGTEDQRHQHLNAIAAGTSTWCQGFSEPGSGSDLASLSLRATEQPNGEWRVSGQKIWTSYAGLADWCFLTARTDDSGPKQHGITIFLVPMDRAGVTVREIPSMLGAHHLNEVFFEDVVVHPGEILGARDDGWSVIQFVLAHERVGIARYARSERILSLLRDHLPDGDDPDEHAMRMTYARLLVRARAARLINYRAIAGSGASDEPDGANLARLASTELDQDVAEFAVEVLGDDGLSSDPAGPLGGWMESAWRYARASTIASGTSEIQRMLAARTMTEGVNR